MSESAIGRMAGASRASANRWARGTHRPDHDPIQRLAARVYRSNPDLARELVEASGYAWAEPGAAPDPPPVPPEVLAVIRKNYPPEQQREVIAMLEELSGGAPGEESGRGDSGPAASRAV